ncbi:hypothetical protein KXS07_23920 [Inquilinus limosus]|uniref:hypothetical protein n=1 Tax=Inquilinus limosus TaxID=171674 RepID=UPI00041020D1|nr:hypothetical protein [Inquilinus limosus]
MDRPTHIVPPIRFTSSTGDEASITVAAALVDHLDALYDTILDPKRREAQIAGSLRAKHLDTIERLLFRVTEEMDRGVSQLSDTLRTQAAMLIDQYRLPAPAAVPARPGRSAGEPSQPTL